MSMFGGKDKSERYQDYLNEDGSLFGKMDYEEWSQIENQAEEISNGTTSGLFNRDERVWQRVKEIDDTK